MRGVAEEGVLEEVRRRAAGSEQPTTEAVAALLARAGSWSASDVHLVPDATVFHVRYRLDGVLHEVAAIPREELPLLVQRVKVLAGLLTYRTEVPQDGRVGAEASPAGCALRVAVLPTLHGEKAVVRLLQPARAPESVEALGWPAEAQGALEAALEEPQGLVVFCGPAGSGKTTTLYAGLRRIVARGGRACASIEDPIEADLAGVDQTAVDARAGLTVGAALRAILRHDPEVVLIGEVRDAETAKVVVEAGLTGHLALTTVHAATAPEALSRLLDLAVEPALLTSALEAVFAQRLVRRCCAACVGAGCEPCRGTGFRGRVPLVEALRLDAGLKAAVLERAPTERLVELGGAGLLTHARARVEAGETTWAEVRRVLGPRLVGSADSEGRGV